MGQRYDGYSHRNLCKMPFYTDSSPDGFNKRADKSVFYAFHDLLRTMFSNLFAVCRYEDFDGSFLLCWKGWKSEDPILLMNHHDVLEALGSWMHEPFSRTIASARYPFKTYPCIICWGNRLGRQKTPFVRHVFFIRA